MDWIWTNNSLSFPVKKDHQMKVAGDRLQTNQARYFWIGSTEVLICWSSSLHLGWFVRQLIIHQIIVWLLSKLGCRALFIREILLNVGVGLWSLTETTPQIIFLRAKSIQLFNKVLWWEKQTKKQPVKSNTVRTDHNIQPRLWPVWAGSSSLNYYRNNATAECQAMWY